MRSISRSGTPGFIIRRTVSKTPPTATGIVPVRTRALQPAAHLDTWVERPWTDGVQVDALRDLDVLFVRTMNTVYHITVEGPAALAVGVATALADADGIELISSESPSVVNADMVRLGLAVEGELDAVTAGVATVRDRLPASASIGLADA